MIMRAREDFDPCPTKNKPTWGNRWRIFWHCVRTGHRRTWSGVAINLGRPFGLWGPELVVKMTSVSCAEPGCREYSGLMDKDKGGI